MVALLSDHKFFPIISMLLAVGASISYACAGDVRHTIYWAAAAVITASVTF